MPCRKREPLMRISAPRGRRDGRDFATTLCRSASLRATGNRNTTVVLAYPVADEVVWRLE